VDTLSSSPSPSRSDDTWERITRPIASCLNLQLALPTITRGSVKGLNGAVGRIRLLGHGSLRELLQSCRLYEDAKENNKERTKDNETEM